MSTLQTTKLKNSQKGFTLVELAIVLVIIGLIVSSVLVGQDLIRAAELRNVSSFQNEVKTAMQTFRTKYPGIPGDINGVRYGLGPAQDGAGCGAALGAAPPNGQGDGNGLIEDADPGTGTLSNTHDGEVACFWAHLTTANVELIGGSFNGNDGANNTVGTHMPAMRTAQTRGWGVFTDGADNFLITGVVTDAGGDSYDIANVFIPLDAFNIDEKIDDGIPNSGIVQALSNGTDPSDSGAGGNTEATTITPAVFNGAGGEACAVSSTPQIYQEQAELPNCALRFQLPDVL